MTQVERLSKIDALFLNADSNTVVNQYAFAFILEGRIEYEQYAEWLVPRVNQVPRLTHILKPAPLHLRYPEWVPDDMFDLDNHLFSVGVEAPGTNEQLREQLTELYHRRLPRDRPLWRMYVVNGLEGDRSAFLLCVHHCMADGAGLMEILKVFFDTPPGGWPPHVQASREQTNHISTGWVPVRVVRTLASRTGRARIGTLLRYLRAPGPWFPFIRPVSGKMHFAWWQIPLEELQAVRSALGGTVTDVIITILAAGLSRYAEAHGIPVNGQFLRLQLQANVRLKEHYGKLGNEVSAVSVLVPLAMSDPAERLRHVAEYTRAAKALGMADFMRGFFDGLLGLLTPPGQVLAGKLLTSKSFLCLNRRIVRSPWAHTSTTSVIMLRTEYRVQGHAVLTLLPFVPCVLDVGLLNVGITYQDHMQFTLTADVNGVPDLDGLMGYMKMAFGDLKSACDSL